MMKNTKFVCIHGHFYQPPRENAWLEIIELQDGAAPFHDWNEKINYECYARNATARILDNKGIIQKITNNYSKISFNFGPTLLSWLEKADSETYKQILWADKRSQERFGGHGSAIAQAYSHLIMPLANVRDKVTQVRWGIADFVHRFGRQPEGMWLSETAADTPTLEILAEQGIKFTILAPRQAKAFRKIGDKDWTASHDSIDPRRAYQCNLPSGKSIALFFYDGNISNEIAFRGLLNNGDNFANRMKGVLDGSNEPQLAHIATDGESYGHHHRFGEMALAHCLDTIPKNPSVSLTVYGEFLEKFPPTYEAQIHESSSWSCVHGVERWRSDCGCNTSSQPGWNQRWRGPLRDALDWLREELLVLFEKEASPLVHDIWEARNDYISIILDERREVKNQFINRHASKELGKDEKTKLLRLMEMQRHAMLMYTSCAWFFAEVSGIETNQVMQYALRAMYYARYVADLDLQPEFVRRLEQIPSNVYPNAAASFEENVLPAQMGLTNVAMHYAASSIFEDYEDRKEFLHYVVENEVFDRIEAGFQRLAFGRTKLVSQLTFSEKHFSFAVLYLGQHNMVGSISTDLDQAGFDKLQAELTAAFRQTDIGDVILLLEKFGPTRFSFKHLFKDEKRKIMRQIMGRNLPPVETAIRDYYDDNYQLMTAMLQSNIPLPETWRNIAQYVINGNFYNFFENGKLSSREFKGIAAEFKRWGVSFLDEPELNFIIGERIFQELKLIGNWQAGFDRLKTVLGILTTLEQMNFEPEFWKSQTLFYHYLRGYRKGEWVWVDNDWKNAAIRLGQLLKVETERLTTNA